MSKLSGDTFERPPDLTDGSDPRVLYVRSYLLTRAIVGILGIALPLALIVGEAFFLDGTVQVRGSISAYYHTAMRDIFVAGLCVTGFLLMTYMSGQTRTWDFRLSLVAGVAVLGVALFPTGRPDLSPDAVACGATTSAPAGCSAIQQRLGETFVAGIHFTSAVVFIVSLGVLAFFFASREYRFDKNVGLARLLRGCGVAIFVAIAWVAVGGLLDATMWGLTPLYVGEVVSVWAFGVAWLVKGRDLRKTLVRDRNRTHSSPGDAAVDPDEASGSRHIGQRR